MLAAYFHVAFTLPTEITDIAAAADTSLTIADDAKHRGARVGITAVLLT